MAQGATIYTVAVDLAHVDRGVYESFELRLARHPSETADYMVTRLLAYCLEHQDGIAFGDDVSTGDEPAVVVRDLTGRLTAWIEVGMPSAERVHRGSKKTGRAAVYTHRDVRHVLSQLDGQGVHRAEEIPVYALDRQLVDALAAALERRTTLAINVMDGQVYVEGPAGSQSMPLDVHRFA